MQHHIIKQQLFEVEFTNADGAHELQNKISDVFNNQLSDGMEKLFNRLVPADLILSMGDVDIDIGNIAYNQLEHQLADRILAELEKEIKYKLALVPSPNGKPADNQHGVNAINANYIRLLEYFLLTGAMPWWASGNLMTDALAVINILLIQDTGNLKQLLIDTGQQSYVRQRLVNQFPREVIRNIISILEPAEAAFIFDYHTTIIQTHHKEKLIENAPADAFEKALWLFILTYILVDKGSLFNQKMFVQATLSQMAHHYNRTYADILSLLSKSLAKYNITGQQSHQLLLIINDLSVDEFEYKQIVKQRGIAAGNNVDDAAHQDFELIKHYLVFGSLPWWSEPYGAESLATLLLNLIKSIPKVLQKLIVTIGQREEVRTRITTVFKEEIITGIVKILEPTDAEFIINYVTEVQDIHVKKPVVYSDGNDFKKAVWKFVFDFLLTERGSEFNRRIFLESNIRKLAANYNVQYTEMLVYLVQSIGQVHQDNIEQAPLFKLLALLLQDNNQSLTPIERIQQADLHQYEINTSNTAAQKLVTIKDVLLYWLNYGQIPWWGSAYVEQGIANTFLSMLAMAPNEAFTLLKYAGTAPNTRKRVIYQLPAELVIDIFSQQPGVLQAVKYYRYLLQAATNMVKKLQTDITTAQIETVLLNLFWDEHITGQYKSFNYSSFVQKGILYLLTHFSKNSQKSISVLSKTFKALNEPVLLQSLDAAKADLSKMASPIDDLLTLTLSDDETLDIVQIIATHLSAKAPTEQEVTNEILRIIEYFVSNNKLPQQFKSSNQGYIDAVIKQLLVIIRKRSADAYKHLLAKAAWLKKYTSGTPQNEVIIAGSIEELISDYLYREKQIEKEIPKEIIINEGFAILHVFLTTGKLPSTLNKASISINLFLKQLLLMLHYAVPGTLADVLQRDGYLAPAKMQLHNAFAIATNTAENNVNGVLKAYIEKDIVEYLKTLSPTANVTNEFAVVMGKYLSYSTANYQLIISVIKQASAARYVARYYTNDEVRQMLNTNTSIIGGTENFTWLSDLQLLITSKVGNTLQRDRLNTLIREFNLLAIGGHINTTSFTAYVNELFGFINAQNNALFNVLADAIIKAESQGSLSPLFTSRMPVVLAGLNTQKAIERTAQNVKKQLSKANDSALQNLADLNSARQKTEEANQIKDEIKKSQQQLEEAMKNETKKLLATSEEAVYINNAGLVLLNPFFSTFFVRLGIMVGGKFINEEAQLRAVHLLQYLVDGSADSPEHLLVLNKILCNVPIEEPVPKQIEVTDLEKETAEGLLKAVLGNWDKLKNTSIAGLRGSFLIRDGALVFKDDAWNLKIDQRGYDVLLQTLPWGIGMIKMPWMDKFLYVEWI